MAAVTRASCGEDAQRERYELERTLAARLRSASRDERRSLYGEVYEELRSRGGLDVPPSPEDEASERIRLVSILLGPYLRRDAVVLELGAGDGAVARALASRVACVYAVEAAPPEVAAPPPANFHALVGDAASISLPDASIDVAFSIHFIEHLHPDDAVEHSGEVHRMLRPGGVYVCVTPNRLHGPHDVSRGFDEVASGLHLVEYTYGEIADLLGRGGFSRIEALRGIGRPPVRRSLLPLRIAEAWLLALPPAWRRRTLSLLSRGTLAPFRPLEQVVVVAERELADGERGAAERSRPSRAA